MELPDSVLYFGTLRSDYIISPRFLSNNTFKALYSGKDDEEFQNFLKVKNAYSNIWLSNCKVKDVSGSIFSAAPDCSLAIGISADFKMERGIAVKFKERYSCIEIFKKQKLEIGGLVFVNHRETERFIYYLVIMPVYNICPTYYSIWMAMQKLKENVLKYQIKKIGMAHIGCEMTPELTWEIIKPLIEYTFKDVPIEINAYEGKSLCLLHHDIEDCHCYGHSLIPTEEDNTNSEYFNHSKQDAIMWENDYYKYSRREQTNNHYKYCDQARKDDFSEYSSLLGKGNFWEYNSQTRTRNCRKYGMQGKHSAYNTFNTRTNVRGSTRREANHHGTENEEDVYHKYCIKVGNDYYVKYSTEDAANDYYGGLY